MASWSEPQGLTARKPRDWSRIRQWIVNLDTGRFGDWVIVETPLAANEDDVLKALTRAQRRKATSVREVTKRR